MPVAVATPGANHSGEPLTFDEYVEWINYARGQGALDAMRKTIMDHAIDIGRLPTMQVYQLARAVRNSSVAFGPFYGRMILLCLN